jgi:uncharacterized protein involved in exopolysaccharide biosynthesis
MQGWAVPPQGSQQGVTSSAAPVAERTVLTPADFRKILIKRKWIIIFGLIVGIGYAIFYIVTTIPQYEAVARLHIDLSRSTNIGIEDLIEQKLGGGEDTAEKLQTEIRIMQSESVIMEVVNSLDLYHKRPFSGLFTKQPYNGQLSPAQRYYLIAAFQGATKIIVLPNTEVVEVHFQNSDPAVAATVANSIVDAYLDRDLRSRFEGTTRVSNWLTQQLAAVKKQVEDSQKSLTDYQRQNNLLTLDAGGGSLLTDSLRTVNQQLAEAEADRIVKEARYKMAQTRNPDLLISVAPGTVLGSLRSQQAELMVQAAQLKSKFGPDYPKVRELDKQLISVQADIDTEINDLTKRFAEEYNAAVKTESLLQDRLNKTKQEAFKENESAAQFDILKHGAESASELYDNLQMKLKEAGITAGLNSNNVDIIDRASIPPFPVLPKKRSALIFGFLGGLIGGIALAAFFESLDDTIRTSDDAEAVYLSTSDVGCYPAFRNRRTEERSHYTGGEGRTAAPAQGFARSGFLCRSSVHCGRGFPYLPVFYPAFSGRS